MAKNEAAKRAAKRAAWRELRFLIVALLASAGWLISLYLKV
ncbi:hypothetical protein [Leisingera sp. F5]|nr:hypothetical protein [Leisingera sp. F5]